MKIPKYENVFKLSVYADDVVSGKRDINVMLKILDDFKDVSSAKVNWSKSVVMLSEDGQKQSQVSQGA